MGRGTPTALEASATPTRTRGSEHEQNDSLHARSARHPRRLRALDHAGAYPVRGVVDVLQALALAGGPTEYANRGGIVVIRRADDGKEARYNVNYREVLSGKAQAIRLIPGDTVFVP